MLPLYGLAVVAAQTGATQRGFVAITIVVAQGVMIVASLVAMRLAEKEGYWLVLLISFIALPDPRRDRRHLYEPMGRLSCADPRRHRRRAAERAPCPAWSHGS